MCRFLGTSHNSAPWMPQWVSSEHIASMSRARLYYSGDCRMTEAIHYDRVKRNTLWMILGQGGTLILQTAYFTLMARTLGSDKYGAFAAVAAIGSLIRPFVGNG